MPRLGHGVRGGDVLALTANFRVDQSAFVVSTVTIVREESLCAFGADIVSSMGANGDMRRNPVRSVYQVNSSLARSRYKKHRDRGTHAALVCCEVEWLRVNLLGIGGIYA